MIFLTLSIYVISGSVIGKRFCGFCLSLHPLPMNYVTFPSFIVKSACKLLILINHNYQNWTLFEVLEHEIFGG